MTRRTCSILTCKNSFATQHRFPNPSKDFERYKLWLWICGNVELLTLDPAYVYESKRVCTNHFSTKQFLSNKRLLRNAVPDLSLPSPINMRDPNFSKIAKPKPSDINITLFDEATVYNEKLSEFHDSLGKQLRTEVVDTLNRSNILSINRVTKTNASNSINEMNMETDLILENTNQKLKEDRREFCLTVDNINVVCRTCLKQNECKDLFSNCMDNLNCAQILEMFTSIKLDPKDGFSLNICNECISELVHCYSFRQKCQKSQYILHEFKFELEKIEKKNLSSQQILNESLLDHDYEHTNNEINVSNFVMTEKLREIEREVDMSSSEASETPKYKKRFFYVLKSNLKENKLTDIDKNLIEINEKKAQHLIQKSAESHQKIFLSNAIDNTNTSYTNIPEDTNKRNDNNIKSVESSLLRSALITRRKSKYTKMQQAKSLTIPFSDTTQKVIKLLLARRTQQANRLVKLPLTSNRRRRKVREKKNGRVRIQQVFPGNCRVCDVPFQIEADYKEHAKATKHYFIEFTCDVCSKVFPRKCHLIKHKESHTDIKRYMCEKCGLCFREKSTLSSHMKVHFKNAILSFVCETCGEVYKCKSDYLKHRRVKHVDKKFCCEICGAFLINRACLMQHKKRAHMNPKKLEKCFICDKGISKFLLKRHMRTHVSEKVKCKLCNCSFKYQLKYVHHLKNRHPGADENATSEDQIKIVECFYCQEICQNNQSVSIHMSEVHGYLTCKYCDETFQTDDELATHYVTHSNIKEFSCRYCGKTYDSWDSLYVHLGKHTLNRLIKNSSQFGTKFYPCQFCSKRFLYKSSQEIHHRIHTGERPYVCDICGKGSVCSSSFKRHKSTHLLQNGQKI